MLLPYYLVHSILLLSVRIPSAQAQDEISESIAKIAQNDSTLDIGFSPRREWSIDHGNQTCPAPELDNTPEEPTPPDKDDFVSFEEWKRIRQASTPLPPPTEHAEPPNPPLNTGEEQHEEPIPIPRSNNRYNYASPDCSARTLKSSPQTQHASSILHKSKDRYMLTPCKANEHWVTIELCDEIRIESFEIAVWEFFSGIVRDVKISVENEDGTWKEVGSFVGRNVRGIQTFDLAEPTSFYRFIRMDFPTHYGSEYYCPVSHLKVYGMNQMEAFKWEQKHIPAKPIIEANDERRIKEEEERATVNRQRRKGEAEREKELGELEKLVHREAIRARSANTTVQISRTSSSTTLPVSSTKLPPATSSASSNETTLLNDTTETTTRRDQSESIYATINRRLNSLEGNSSLIARYIEEQSRVMRSALAALERDWDEWRLERDTQARTVWDQERMRQEDRLGKIISMIESQRVIWDNDRQSVNAQLRLLTDELSYERRRGLVQMAILVIVIALGIASRSSAIDAVLKPLVAVRPEMARPRFKSISKSTPKRPSTPNRRGTPNFRSFSIMDPRNAIPQRRLAKSAHLHALKPLRADDTEVTDVEDTII